MLIYQYLEQNAEKYTKETAIIELNYLAMIPDPGKWREGKDKGPLEPYRREITWEVFNERANRIANFLISCGIRKGDHIAIMLKNCLEWMPIYFGILKTDAIAVMLNYRFNADKIKTCLDKVNACAFIFGPECSEIIKDTADQLG